MDSKKNNKELQFEEIIDHKKKILTDDIFHITNKQRKEYNPTLSKIMSKNIIGCKPTDTLEHVFKVMVKYGFKRLPVVDEHYQLVGIVTDRDIRVYSKSPLEISSEEEWFNFLKEKIVTDILPPKAALQLLKETDSTLDACKLMIQSDITGLPVVDESGKLTGIVTRSDLLDQFIRIAEPMYTYQSEQSINEKISI